MKRSGILSYSPSRPFRIFFADLTRTSRSVVSVSRPRALSAALSELLSIPTPGDMRVKSAKNSRLGLGGEYSKYAGRRFVHPSLWVPTECILCGPH